MRKVVGRFARALGRRSRRDPIVVVSGLPRSGTSMMMKMLEAGGVPPVTDGEREADSDNPRGYYELEAVKRLPDGDDDWLDEAEGHSVKVVSSLLGYLPDTYEYRIVFMRRPVAEILASQKKMLRNRGEESDQDDATLAAMFESHVRKVQAWVAKQPNMSVLYVDYGSVISDPGPVIEALGGHLGRAVDVEAMSTVVDPALYRQRKN